MKISSNIGNTDPSMITELYELHPSGVPFSEIVHKLDMTIIYINYLAKKRKTLDGDVSDCLYKFI